MSRVDQKVLVPEDRVHFGKTKLPDRSAPDGFVGPAEPPEIAQGVASNSVESVVQDFVTNQTVEGARVLIFEPTRPDLRRAILRAGRSYIDAGRLLNGEPDPATLALAIKQKPGLIILDEGDTPTLPTQIPVLIDRRSSPLGSTKTGSPSSPTHHSLVQFGPRDGVKDTSYSWILGLQEPPPLIRKRIETPEFQKRQAQRRDTISRWLSRGSDLARVAGFEPLVQAGFLWLSIPGVPSPVLAKSFLGSGVRVFYANHHPYRHRVRLCPAANEEDLALWSAIDAVGAALGN